jgi:DNA-binding response OmpR family regulator
MANIVLTGLDGPAGTALRRVLSDEGHEVTSNDCFEFSGADAVFCNGDYPGYPALVRRIRDLKPELPVVVVTRLPESDKWLNALEAGAADYCSAPFEAIQVRWIVSSVLRRADLRSVA